MSYTIISSTNRAVSDLEKNGDNYVSKTEIDESIFDSDLLELIISDGEKEEVLKNMQFIQQMKIGDEYYICFREVPDQELKYMKDRSDIEFIAMMSDIDLEV